ncbi:hypothetical protein SAMN04489802_2850 [Pseudomonas chlororaphis]|nr:hypothetical protein [Pseudomonas chlororaphis]AZD67563.1 hypothetical protein C4K17_3677 [Pseudomonas chlororaphis subsp. aurantiaca]QIT23533.1 hypothetical protein HCN09_17975 [Pseudomonas chlororaphis subsp. aurantiaca]WDH01626.1 hypothetical protein PUP57_19100 [Pseudomonas chlororaphis]WDH09526.1 hypothetical protein PUP64_27910 [Pseudomonas chlororaphis]SDS99103.1 hypothetical protein SAMN04489802_2850 [Pseudomonas chlororaphis]
MKKAICSDAKDSAGKPMWCLMPDGSFFISQESVDQASIQHLKLKR